MLNDFYVHRNLIRDSVQARFDFNCSIDNTPLVLTLNLNLLFTRTIDQTLKKLKNHPNTLIYINYSGYYFIFGHIYFI